MEEVGYAQPAHLPNGRAFGLSEDDDDYVDVRYADAPSYLPSGQSVVPIHRPLDQGSDPGDPLGSMMQRAMGEQIAEQRMIREALTEFDRRVEILERSLADRVSDLERDVASRIEYFERSITERMAAFEAVLKRVVDRLGGSEERLFAGIDHSDKMMRAQLDALRPAFEGAVDRVVEWVEQLDASNVARQAALRDSFENALGRIDDAMASNHEMIEDQMSTLADVVDAAVHASMGEPLEQTLAEVRASLESTERRVRRDVNRLTHMMRGDGEPFPGFEPVRDREAAIDARIVDAEKVVPRRNRPLRAKRPPERRA